MDKDRDSIREENRRRKAEEKARRAEERKKAQEKKKEERAKAKEQKERNRQAQNECNNTYGAKERFLSRLRSELWKGIPMSSASKRKYSEYLERIGQRDGNKPDNASSRYCKPLSMIGLSESEIRADLSAYAEKDREAYMEKEAEKLARKKEERDRKAEEKKKKAEEKEESRRINVIRDRNQKDLRSIKSSLWGKYKMTADSKREYTALITKATSRDERFTEDELDEIRETLRPYADSDIEKQKQAYDEKHYKTVKEERTDEDGNVITTERKEKKTFCDRHPDACATGKAVGSGVKKAGEAVGSGLKKTGEALDKGFTAAGGAIVEGGRALGKGAKKMADYIMDKDGSDDYDDEPDTSPDMDEDESKRPSGKKPSGKPSKKPKKEDEDGEGTFGPEDEDEPPRPQKKPQKKPQRKREERYEEVDETDERDTKEDDDDDSLAPAFRDDRPRSSQRRNTQQNNCSCPVPKKHESEGDSMPPVFAEEPRSKTVTKTEDDDWGMPALFVDDAPAPKKKAKKRTADDDDGMPALFREDPAPKKKKNSAESMDFSMPALFMDDPEPRKKRSSSAKKTSKPKTATAKAKPKKTAQTSSKGKGTGKKTTGRNAKTQTKKKTTTKKPAPKKKKKDQGGNDWLTDGDAGLF